MKHISDFLANYAVEHDYYWLTETDAGNNQQIDKFLLSTQEYALYYNIIESGEFTVNDTNSRVSVVRTIELCLFKKDIKEDLGVNYFPILECLLEKQVDIYKALTKEFEINSATYQNGVDSQDATLAVVKLTITYTENYSNC